jgi:hypothetical protein
MFINSPKPKNLYKNGYSFNAIYDIFEEAKLRYKELQVIDISLQFGNRWFFTMYALIIPRYIFCKKRKYCIRVNLKRKDILLKLSRNDLIGWFGHEFAHVVEYEKMSNYKLLLFFLRYLVDLKFRFIVEKRVSAFAFNNGFTHELLYVWKKFLSIDTASAKYKKYIIENYFPRWEDIKETAQNQGISKQFYESLR